MTHVTCGLTAKYRDHLRNPTLGSRVWATFTFLCLREIGELSKTGWTDRHAVIGQTGMGRRNHVLDGVTLTPPGEYD